MACSYCNAEKVLARGLCSACYQRQWNSGSLAKKNARNIGPCSIPGCRDPAATKGFCRSHYEQNQHPLKNTWKLIRSRYPDAIPRRWDDFDQFLRDVGERPTPRHQLRRVDDAEPYSPANVRWIEPVKEKDCYTPEQRSEYQHVWSLRKHYGLSKEAYDKMLSDQGGVCAICGNGQSHNGRDNAPARLCVDHCHTTGKVRGLLCVSCNRLLGYAKDDPKLLRSAIAYLRRA